MKQQTFGVSRPSIAYELQYRRALNQLIKLMQGDVVDKLTTYYNRELAMDAEAKDVRAIMKELRSKWYGKFDKRGAELSRWFAESADKRTKKELSDHMRCVGLTIEPTYNRAQKKLIGQLVKTNVQLIKSIPQQYLRGIEQTIKKATVKGGDLEAITKEATKAYREKFIKQLSKSVDEIDKQALNRASLIARDQNNKITQQLMATNAQALGATKGVWLHVPGKYSARVTHIAMNGKVFDLDKGLHDTSVGREVKPGELPYCNCQFKVLMPGFE